MPAPPTPPSPVRILDSHAEEVPKGREMTATYNFVPLPPAPLPAADAGAAPPDASRFEFGRHSGTLELTVTALSPLYTRAAVPPDQDDKASAAAREFFHHGDSSWPVLPGATVRGMTRALVTVLAHGKFPRFKDRRLFFRSFSGKVMNLLYTAALTENIRHQPGPNGTHQAFRPRVQAGYLFPTAAGGAEIEPAWHLRVTYNCLGAVMDPADLGIRPPRASGAGAIQIPNPAWQYRRVWAQVPTPRPDWHFHAGRAPGQGMYTWRRNADAVALADPGQPAWTAGNLIVTGPMKGKRGEHILVPQPGSKPIAVSNDVLADANDEDDQISQWQEQAFPQSRASARPGTFAVDPHSFPNYAHLPSRPSVSGGVAVGLPVWFLQDGAGKVVCLGRAANFRLRYNERTGAFVPAHLRADEPLVDLPERLFGRVRQGGENAEDQIRGRVRFEDLRCMERDPFLPPVTGRGQDPGYRIPRILSSPKPTAFQTYVAQPHTGDLDLRHYHDLTYRDPASGQFHQAVIRGTKFYWHRNQATPDGRRQPLGQRALFRDDPALRPTSQETVIRPVKDGTVFRGRVRFDNLNEVELGALLAALELPSSRLAHRLGMGKPLGMGSVRIAVRPRLVDRRTRYRGMSGELPAEAAFQGFNQTGAMLDAETDAVVTRARAAFDSAVREWLVRSGQVLPDLLHEGATAWQTPRGKVLEMLLTWEDAPDGDKTRAVPVDGDDGMAWRWRKVLPGPHQVLGRTDPMRGMPTAVLPGAPERDDAGTERETIHDRTPRSDSGAGARPPLPAGRPPDPRAGEGVGRPPAAPPSTAAAAPEVPKAIPPGRQTVQIARLEAGVYIAFHPPTGLSLPIRKMRLGALGSWVLVNVTHGAEGAAGQYLGEARNPDPDELPHGQSWLAQVTDATPGQWQARLAGGKRTWSLRGPPPPGVKVATGEKVLARVTRGPDPHLRFALEVS